MPTELRRSSWLGEIAVLLCLMFGLVGLRAITAADGESAGIGGAVALGYKFDRQTTAYRATVSTADIATIGSTFHAGNAAFDTGGRANLPLSARFSDASQTCKVRIIRYYVNQSTAAVKFLGTSPEITLTGTSVIESSLYVADDYVFDPLGASHVRIMVTTAPVSGSVTFWLGSS